MEKEIKDALNFAIGAISSLKGESEKALTSLEAKFKELAEKGAQDTSEVSMNLRKYTEEASTEIEKIITEAKVKFDELAEKAKSIIPENKA
ncbi:MAG: hypothetical protein SFU98_07745 [Leptospiraceae bacterium]|nr:hypothetical protein [Leptospiraceae bacterium]